MKRVWGLVLLLIFSFTFVIGGGNVSALPPDVTILPSEGMSANASFLLKVNPKTTERPIRITWYVYDAGSTAMGSVPLDSSGKGVCYFSNEDGNATCGPSPFFKTGPTELVVNVVTPTKVENQTIPIDVSSMQIPMKDVYRVDNRVFMHIYMGSKDAMTYSIYKEGIDSPYQTNRELLYDEVDGKYHGNITLTEAGVYYSGFVVEESGSYGTAMKRIDIPSEDFLELNTDKDAYWKGEKVTVSGTTNAGDTVEGSIYAPGNDRVEDFTATVKSDKSFSHDFIPLSNWNEGDYEVRTSSPLEKSAEFSVSEFFEIDPEFVSEEVNKSDDFSFNLEVTNIRDNATNVSVSGSGDIDDSYVSISETGLEENGNAVLTINIPSVQSDLQGMIKLSGEDVGVEVEIPVSVTAVEEEAEAETTTVVADLFEVNPDDMVWEKSDCLAGENVNTRVTVTNKGDSILSGFTYDVADLYEGGLEDLDEYQGVISNIDTFSIDVASSQDLFLNITPPSAGRYRGLIKLEKGSDAGYIYIDLQCFRDITTELDSLSDELENMSLPDDVKSGIEADILEARNRITTESYEQASMIYQKARAKIDLLSSGGSAVTQQGGFDFTWVIMVVVIIIIVVVALWFLKFRTPEASEYDEETENLEGF